MKIINHDWDEMRQIVPQDMSNLSDADQELARAMYYVLCTMFGLSAGVKNADTGQLQYGRAIVVQGMEISHSYDATTKRSTMDISEGLILRNGKLYRFGGAKSLDTDMGDEVMWAMDKYNMIVTFMDSVCAPSPVYDGYGALAAAPHKEYVAVADSVDSVSKAENVVEMSQLVRLPAVKTAMALQSIVFRTN